MDLTKTSGRAVLELKANAEYTRHSEGAFLRMKDGSILYAYSRFRESSRDDAPSDIVGCFSYDEGETWTEPTPFLNAADYNSHNIMSVSLLRMQNGDVGLFFGSRQKPTMGLHHLALSNDECKSFYRTVVCSLPDRPGYYVLNNDRVVRLRSGRLVMPLAFHRGGYNTREPGSVYFEWRSVLMFLLSDDDGQTWRESADAVFPPFNRSKSGLQEPGVLEREDGSLWAWARTDRMWQYECFSFDGGEHWTQAQISQFTSPNSPMQVKRRESDRSLTAVWNPIPNYNGRVRYKGFAGRTPIAYARSFDDGVTWTEPEVIEGAEDCGYCYPSIFYTNDGCALVGYCSGTPKEGDCLTNCTVRKIPLPGKQG